VLSVTERSMQNFLCHFAVFAEFFKYLKAFGLKGFARDEGFASFDSKIVTGPDADAGGVGRLQLAR
jgi:hypothetical protein